MKQKKDCYIFWHQSKEKQSVTLGCSGPRYGMTAAAVAVATARNVVVAVAVTVAGTATVAVTVA